MMMSDKEGSKDKKPVSKSGPDEEKVDALVQAALASHLMMYAKKKKDNKQTLSDISNLIHEHLNTFIILGYNYEGDPISSVSANTQQEADSLCTLINKFLLQNAPPPGM